MNRILDIERKKFVIEVGSRVWTVIDYEIGFG